MMNKRNLCGQGVVMVRPVDLRCGHVIVDGDHYVTVLGRPYPAICDGGHRVIVATDDGRRSWPAINAARFENVPVLMPQAVA